MACSQYAKRQTVSVEVLKNIAGYPWQGTDRLKAASMIQGSGPLSNKPNN
jgi:hypothetical protein